MSKRIRAFLSVLVIISAAALIVGCGGGPSTPPYSSPKAGSVVAFGTDAPVCDVESFVATITSASLVPQSGGTPVALITATAPATVDFARLVDFTNILSTASVAPGTYSQLQMTLSNPQLIAINTSTSPTKSPVDSGNPNGHIFYPDDQSGPGGYKFHHEWAPGGLKPSQIGAS